MNRKLLLIFIFILPALVQSKPKEVKLFNGKNLTNWEIPTVWATVILKYRLFWMCKGKVTVIRQMELSLNLVHQGMPLTGSTLYRQMVPGQKAHQENHCHSSEILRL